MLVCFPHSPGSPSLKTAFPGQLHGLGGAKGKAFRILGCVWHEARPL